MTQQLPPDTPKVQVEFETPYTKGTQKLDIQSNRISPIEQFSWKWLNRLYPPADPVDFALDAVSYVVAAGLIASVTTHLLWLFALPVLGAIALALMVGVVILCWLIAAEVKHGWLLLIYRLVLVLIGVLLGGVL